MATNEEIVAAAQQLYVSYYGRPADPEGLAFWIDAFTASDNVDQVLIDFGTSDEFLNEYGSLTTPELITALYQQMFNRDPDAEGLAFYTDLLDSGEASLASIALDIANGATGDDLTILSNKVIVANSFTADVSAKSASYQASDIDDAKALLSAVDATEASVTAGVAASDSYTDSLPVVGAGGEFTIDEDSEVFNASAFTSAVTVILDGDSDEADFDVTLSAFDDTVVLEEFKSAAISDSGGIDTLDTNEHGGTATVNLLAGTFSIQDGADTFKGTISGVENVIGTDGNDVITGDNGDNVITGGDGSDTLKGGIGDDTFVFEDEDQIGLTGTADGQTGTDTAAFTADTVDLSVVADGHLAVENLLLTNIDGEDEVTLTLAASGTANLGTDNFTKITGSSAVDTVQVVGDINVSKVTLADVEILAAVGNARTVTINSSTAGLALVGNAGAGVTNNGTLALSGGGTFDLSSLSLTGFRSYTGGTGTTAATLDTVVLNQAAVDSALANAVAGTLLQENGVFVNLASFNATTGASDVVQLSGNVDFTGFRFDSNLDFSALDFGAATTVLFNDLGATGVRKITGSAGTSDTLVVTPGSTAQNFAPLSVTGVETLLIDVTVGNEGVNVTIDEGTLSGVSTITGEIDLIATTTAATKVVDLSDIVVTEGIDLSSATGVDLVKVTQSVLDGFTTLGANAPLALVMGGALSIDSSDIQSAITVTGTTGDDSLTVDGVTPGLGSLASEDGKGFSFVTGAGNDTLNGGAGGVFAGNVDLGSGSNTLIGVVAGNLDLTDNSAKVLGANDGTNTVIGLVTGTINGGSGSDNISIGGALAGATLGKGNDSFSGASFGVVDLGAGDDTFTSVPFFQSGAPALVIGGSGNDTFNINNAGVTVTGGTGNDVFTINALAFGAAIGDLNVGQKDVLQLDLVGSDVMTDVAVTTTVTTSTSTSTTTNTNTNTITSTTYSFIAGSLTLSTTQTYTSVNGAFFSTTMTGAFTTVGMTTTTTTSTTTTSTSTTTTTSTNTVTPFIVNTTVFGFVSATTGTTTSALAAALTASGGLRVLNQQGNIVVVAPGEAVGTSALGTFSSATNLLSQFLGNTSSTMGIGTTASGGVRQSLADTTYVVFAFSGSSSNLLAFLVTANSTATGTVNTTEISTVIVANLAGTAGITSADIILI